MSSTINVTQPYLPPLPDFLPYLEKIWANKIITNGGPFHQQLESELCNYLGVKHLSLFTNGTIALITALQSLEITGEVITTPYSFVATAHSLLWNKNTPVFVDIEPNTLNLDPNKIEKAITEKTSAIMPVLCYGNPCEFDKIQAIANKHDLKVIYDAAHAFGVKDKSQSVLLHGDLSVLSFHATKVFNTFEGGAIICKDLETKLKIDQLKNFGFTNEVTIRETGINGKMSEINSAFGLIQLKHIDYVLKRRKEIDLIYRKELNKINGIKCVNQIAEEPNYSYFPILVNENYGMSRDELYNQLKEIGINGRRYFYPLISEFPMYQKCAGTDKNNLINASETSKKVICLPIYPDLKNEQIIFICDNINKLSKIN